MLADCAMQVFSMPTFSPPLTLDLVFFLLLLLCFVWVKKKKRQMVQDCGRAGTRGAERGKQRDQRGRIQGNFEHVRYAASNIVQENLGLSGKDVQGYSAIQAHRYYNCHVVLYGSHDDGDDRTERQTVRQL